MTLIVARIDIVLIRNITISICVHREIIAVRARCTNSRLQFSSIPGSFFASVISFFFRLPFPDSEGGIV